MLLGFRFVVVFIDLVGLLVCEFVLLIDTMVGLFIDWLVVGCWLIPVGVCLMVVDFDLGLGFVVFDIGYCWFEVVWVG